MSRLRSLSLYYHTVSRLRPSQVVGTAERKLHDTLVRRLPVDPGARYERRVPADPTAALSALAANTETLRAVLPADVRRAYRRRAEAAVDGEVTFMNRSLAHPTWTDERLEELPRLWRLKLHALEPLWWAVAGFDDPGDARAVVEHLDGWAADWRATVGVGDAGHRRGAWASYAVSLRLLYVLRYLAWRERAATHEGAVDGDPLLGLAYRDALFLADHVETDVGGNHLVENGAALVVAGVCFDEAAWVTGGCSILETAARTQFLADGAHFERSPMYHVLVLTRYLTVVDLLQRTGRPVPEEIRETARAAAGFLSFLRPPDGSLPLLNDAVDGESLPVDACLDYAERVGVVAAADGGTLRSQAPEPGERGDVAVDSADDHHWLRNRAGAMLVDGGPLGPPSLPGHSHLDLLSVLLWVGDTPVVTDTGVFDYESGADRQYARGVRGHNTVQVGDAEPVDIGGRFLMGRRPAAFRTELHRRRFDGRYEARPVDGPSFGHHRSVRVGEDWWFVWDEVTPDRPVATTSRLHLHPDVSVAERPRPEGVELELSVDGSPLAWVYPLGTVETAVVEGPYFPRFGVRRSRSVLELESPADGGPFGFLVSAKPLASVVVEPSETGLPTLVFGGK